MTLKDVWKELRFIFTDSIFIGALVGFATYIGLYFGFAVHEFFPRIDNDIYFLTSGIFFISAAILLIKRGHRNIASWVLAIVWLLFVSSIFLADVPRRGKRSDDAGVKGNLAQLRLDAEVYYDKQKSYGRTPFPPGPCPMDGATDNMFSDPVVRDALVNIKKYNGGIIPTCAIDILAGGSVYAVSSPLKSDRTRVWCVDTDYRQSAREISSPIIEARCP